MPIHDWSRVTPGIFHDFHQAWTIEIRNALNAGVLPEDYFALAEQSLAGPVPDVITLERLEPADESSLSGGGAVAIMDAPPKARYVAQAENAVYASMANRVVVRHHLGRVVAVIEVVSPGNKSGWHALRSFVEKAAELLRGGINLLVVDLFPPTSRDPQGIHKAIWDEITEEPFELPADKPLTVAAYSAGQPMTAYVEPVAVGDELPPLPIFLSRDVYVPAPLQVTYQTTWEECPDALKNLVADHETPGTDKG